MPLAGVLSGCNGRAVTVEAGGQRWGGVDVPPGGPGFFHAVAVDYDGTLAEAGRPDPEAMAGLAAARASGRRIVVVTGRILADLRATFPDVDDYFDMVVAENGAVLAYGGEHRTLVPPLPDELAWALTANKVSFRRGEVLLACDGATEPTVLGTIRELGLDCQLVRNRGALMVLPAGVSKGTGLALGLADLGISCHNTVAIGDAENDHSLLAAAEVGVAVSNAVPTLKAEADVVLTEADGPGIASFLSGPVIAGRQRVHSRRWRVSLGALPDGTPVSIPASQVNVLVIGVAQRGKSYVAGLIAERLIRLGYSVVIVDPEGDHTGLGRLPGVLVAGSGGHLPSAADLADIVRHHSGGVVLDLSAVQDAERDGYLRAAHQELEALRAETGQPHWVIIDEAHVTLARDARYVLRARDDGLLPGHAPPCGAASGGPAGGRRRHRRSRRSRRADYRARGSRRRDDTGRRERTGAPNRPRTGDTCRPATSRRGPGVRHRPP